MAQTKSAQRKRPDPAHVQKLETLSPEELAVMLGCGRTLAYSILARGLIPSYRVGRNRRVLRADAEAWREAQKARR